MCVYDICVQFVKDILDIVVIAIINLVLFPSYRLVQVYSVKLIDMQITLWIMCLKWMIDRQISQILTTLNLVWRFVWVWTVSIRWAWWHLDYLDIKVTVRSKPVMIYFSLEIVRYLTVNIMETFPFLLRTV